MLCALIWILSAPIQAEEPETSDPARWIEDLRSDDVPNNAKEARVSLLRIYSPDTRRRLKAAAGSDDDQQAIQAAFVLAEKGDGRDALDADPRIVERAVAGFVRAETRDYFWVAARVALRLGPLLSETRREAAYGRALQGVQHSLLADDVRDFVKIARELNLPFPTPLLQHYARNLRHDGRDMNAYHCEALLRDLGTAAHPVLWKVLADSDSQARKRAGRLLLDQQVRNLPLSVLAEMMGEDGEALELVRQRADSDKLEVLSTTLQKNPDRSGVLAAGMLLSAAPDRHGLQAVLGLQSILRTVPPLRLRREIADLLGSAARGRALLEDLLRDPDQRLALTAARGLVAIDADRYGAQVLPFLLQAFRTDEYPGGAREAARTLEGLGTRYEKQVLHLLESDDEQVVSWAACVLQRWGRLPRPQSRVYDQLHRFAARDWAREEPEGLTELLSQDVELRTRILDRLTRSGKAGRDRAAGLRVEIERWSPTSSSAR